MRLTPLTLRAVGLAAFIAAAAWLSCQGPATARVRLSFAGYTNDLPGVRREYAIPAPGERSTGLFCLSNGTHHPLLCNRGEIELHTASGWVKDPTWACSGSAVKVSPGQATLFDFRTPAGSNTWRCSVSLWRERGPMRRKMEWYVYYIDVHYQHVGSFLQGLLVDKPLTLWSPEVAR